METGGFPTRDDGPDIENVPAPSAPDVDVKTPDRDVKMPGK